MLYEHLPIAQLCAEDQCADDDSIAECGQPLNSNCNGVTLRDVPPDTSSYKFCGDFAGSAIYCPFEAGPESDQHFYYRRVAEETRRTCRCAVGSGLEHNNQVAGLRFCEIHAISNKIERRTQRTDH
jgi:hypothetical protein